MEELVAVLKEISGQLSIINTNLGQIYGSGMLEIYNATSDIASKIEDGFKTLSYDLGCYLDDSGIVMLPRDGQSDEGK